MHNNHRKIVTLHTYFYRLTNFKQNFERKIKKMDKVSYALGMGIGRQLNDMGAESLNIDYFAQAIKDVLAGGKTQLDAYEAQVIVQEFSRNRKKNSVLRLPSDTRR